MDDLIAALLKHFGDEPLEAVWPALEHLYISADTEMSIMESAARSARSDAVQAQVRREGRGKGRRERRTGCQESGCGDGQKRKGCRKLTCESRMVADAACRCEEQEGRHRLSR